MRANPAGNITLFVLSPVEKKDHASLAEKLMALEQFKAEQVGYCCEPESDVDGHMEMSGGEFCGNATRAYGMLVAQQKKMTRKESLKIRVSGCDHPVKVDVDMEAQTARSEMPLPRFVRRELVEGKEGVLVHLGGIAHFVVENVEPSLAFFEQAETMFRGLNDLDAYGVMFLDGKTHRLTPLVKVPAANSLFWEGSCGSGSLATVIARTEEMADGEYSEDIIQPAGTVRVTTMRKNGRVVAAYIGGGVELDAPAEVEV